MYTSWTLQGQIEHMGSTFCFSSANQPAIVTAAGMKIAATDAPNYASTLSRTAVTITRLSQPVSRLRRTDAEAPIHHGGIATLRARTLSAIVVVLLMAFVTTAGVPSLLGSQSWPKWSIDFTGDGWEVRDGEGPEVIKVAENPMHNVGLFIAGLRFGGSLDQLEALTRAKSPSEGHVGRLNINDQTALELITPPQTEVPMKSWTIFFLKDGAIISIAAMYQNDSQKEFLAKTIWTFRFL